MAMHALIICAASAALRSGGGPMLADPAAVSNPVIAAAAVATVEEVRSERFTLLHLFTQHPDPTPPAWITDIDRSLLHHGHALETAWQLAGGDDLGMWMNNVGALSTLAAFSMQDVLLLRCLSLVGQLCGIYFCATREPALWNPVAWQSVFLAVNAANTIAVVRERFGTIVLRPREQDVYEQHFLAHGVTLRQFQRLLACAQWRSVGPGRLLAIEGGEASDEQSTVQLTLLHSGAACIKESGKVVATLGEDGHEPTDFIGDFDFLHCLIEADADAASPLEQELPESCVVPSRYLSGGPLVTVETTARRNVILQFNSMQLRDALLEDVNLRVRMLAVLTSKLMAKMEAAKDEARAELLDSDGEMEIAWSGYVHRSL